MSKYTQEQRAAAIKLINEFVQSDYDYHTQHQDAGDSYAYLVAEEHKSSDDATNAILTFCKEENLPVPTETEIDFMVDSVQMVSYGLYHPSGVCVVGAYDLGEIEINLEDRGLDYHLIMAVSYDCEAYISGGSNAYINTDCVWYAVLTPEIIVAVMNQHRN